MSRRKQHKPQAMRTDQEESSFMSSKESDQVIGGEIEEDISTKSPISGNSSNQEDFNLFGKYNKNDDAADHKSESETKGRPDEEDDDCSPSPGAIKSSTRTKNGKLTFACTYCPLLFETYSQVKNHEQVHADLMPYRCSFCEKGFKHKRSVDRHIKLHSGIKKYKCEYCSTAFFRSDHLKLHLRTHETSKYQFSCAICQRGFHSSAGLESHIVIHKMNGGNNADNNDETFVVGNGFSTDELDSMIQEAQNINVERKPECSKDFLDVKQNNIKNKLEQETENGIKTEEIDDTVPLPVAMEAEDEKITDEFSKAENSSESPNIPEQRHHSSLRNLLSTGLMNHIAASRATPSDPVYNCDQCDRQFESILDLHDHSKACHDDDAISNNNPDQNRTSLDGAIVAMNHNGIGKLNNASHPEIYQCSQCDASLVGMKAFTTHMRQHVTAPRHQTLNGFSSDAYDNHSATTGGIRSILATPSEKRPMPPHHNMIMSPQLRCDMCHLTLPDAHALEIHTTQHYVRREVIYGCRQCGLPNGGVMRQFNTRDELLRHMAETHCRILYKCTICQDVFDCKENAQSHFSLLHTAEQCRLRCRSCNALFASEEQFRLHVKVAHAPSSSAQLHHHNAARPPYHQSQTQRHLHASSSLANPFTCPLCFEAFSVEYLFDKHMETVHKNTTASAYPFLQSCFDQSPSISTKATPVGLNKCNICDEKFSTLSELSAHKLAIHCKVQRSELCNICHEPIIDEQNFYTHVRAHTTRGVQPCCVVCRQSLASVIEMQAHAKYHCGSSETMPSPAPSRPLSMPNQTPKQLQNSMTEKIATPNSGSSGTFEQGERKSPENAKNCNNTQNNKQYHCIKCQKSFETEVEIHAHISSHVINDGLEHKCHLCRRVYDSPSKLQRHLIEHACHCVPAGASDAECARLAATCGDFRCPACDERCADASALQAHVLASGKHLPVAKPGLQQQIDQRPFACDWCEQRFFFDAELENHVLGEHALDQLQNTMDQSTPTAFICCLCGLAFGSPAKLKLHSAECQARSSNGSAVDEDDENEDQNNSKTTTAPSEGGSFSFEPNCSNNNSADGDNKMPKYDILGPSKSILAELMTRNGPKTGGANERKTRHNNSNSYKDGIYQCPNCPKSFQSMSALQGHSHVHMNTVKEHHCDQCKRTFQTAAKLRNHQRQHVTTNLGDKPFMCHLCGRYFSRKDNLKVHLKTHFKNGVQVPISDNNNNKEKRGFGRPVSSQHCGDMDDDVIMDSSHSKSMTSYGTGRSNLSRAFDNGLPSMVVPSFGTGTATYNDAIDIEDD